MSSEVQDNKKWYAVQVRSNMEQKVLKSMQSQIDTKDMSAYISKEDIIMPEERVSVFKDGAKSEKTRKLYPGYIFIKVKLYEKDEEGNDKLQEAPWYFIRAINGVINFMGGKEPIALKKSEIDRIFEQMKNSAETVKLGISFNVGDTVKINEGPFMSLTGLIEEIDSEHGKLKVSVSIFGRFTPVELDYKQVSAIEE